MFTEAHKHQDFGQADCSGLPFHPPPLPLTRSSDCKAGGGGGAGTRGGIVRGGGGRSGGHDPAQEWSRCATGEDGRRSRLPQATAPVPCRQHLGLACGRPTCRTAGRCGIRPSTTKLTLHAPECSLGLWKIRPLAKPKPTLPGPKHKGGRRLLPCGESTGTGKPPRPPLPP